MARDSKDLIKIRRGVCEKHGLRIGQFMALLFFHVEGKHKFDDVIDQLLDMGLITPKYRGPEITTYGLMDEGIDLIDTIMLESEDNDLEEQDLDSVVEELRSLFPGGMKQGTSQHWRGGTREIKNRLLSFFKKYGDYDFNEVIDAARRYVRSFDEIGSYQNMRLLKYFIWKRENKHGEVEESSDLLSFLENKEVLNEINHGDWTTKLK